MRIAFFVNYSHAVGTYFRWHNLAIALTQLGHQVDVYAGDHNWKAKIRHEVIDDINYYVVPSLQTVRIFYRPNDFFTGLRRLFYLPKKQYEVYHLFQPFINAYIPWSFLKLSNRKAIFIYDWDDLWTHGLLQKHKNLREAYFNRITAILEKRIPASSDGVTVCSEFLMKTINTPVPVKVLANGYWPKDIPIKSESRKKWGLEDNLFYIAYIGKTATELDWIIEAFEKIRQEKLSDVRLVIVGPPLSQINEFSDEQKINLVYLGEVSPAEAREIATAVDLGLIPLENSLFNQSRFPIKFFDFLTVKTPVYMSDVGEIALIGKMIDKAIIGSSDKLAWVSGLTKAIDTVKNTSFSNSTEPIVNSYTWINLALQQVDFYERIVNLKSRND